MPSTETTPRFHTTVTERSSFRTCRRQWYWENIALLEPQGSVAWALIYGTVMHEALDVYYSTQRDLAKTLKAFKKAWTVEDNRLEREYGGLYKMGIEQEWWEYHGKGLTTLKYYDQHDRESGFFDTVVDVGLGFDKWRQNVSVEERYFIEILDLNGEPYPEHPLLSGRVDLAVLRSDGIWIVDHKNLASSPSWRALEVDDQITGYCYIYWKITEKIPRGALYNVLLKDPPKPPRLIQDGTKLSQDKAQRTTFDLYMDSIKENGFDLADYEDFLNFLAKKGWNTFFPRDGHGRNLQELQSFERRLSVEYLDMKQAIEDPAFRYPNPSQRICSGCPFVAPCQAMEDGSDAESMLEQMYQKKEPRHTIPEGV